MITTPDLINSLTADAAPVRRLRPPLVRTLGWLTCAAVLVALLAMTQGVRPDLAERLRQPMFVVGIVAMIATGILAAIATFVLSLPDRSRLSLLLPAPSFIVWVSAIGYRCLTDPFYGSLHGLRFDEAVGCFATLVLTSVPLSLAMLVMVRHAALLQPTAVIMTGSLSVAAVTATALSLFHDLSATATILIWNLGTSALIIALGYIFGPKLLFRVSPRPILDHA